MRERVSERERERGASLWLVMLFDATTPFMCTEMGIESEGKKIAELLF